MFYTEHGQNIPLQHFTFFPGTWALPLLWYVTAHCRFSKTRCFWNPDQMFLPLSLCVSLCDRLCIHAFMPVHPFMLATSFPLPVVTNRVFVLHREAPLEDRLTIRSFVTTCWTQAKEGHSSLTQALCLCLFFNSTQLKPNCPYQWIWLKLENKIKSLFFQQLCIYIKLYDKGYFLCFGKQWWQKLIKYTHTVTRTENRSLISNIDDHS